MSAMRRITDRDRRFHPGSSRGVGRVSKQDTDVSIQRMRKMFTVPRHPRAGGESNPGGAGGRGDL